MKSTIDEILELVEEQSPLAVKYAAMAQARMEQPAGKAIADEINTFSK